MALPLPSKLLPVYIFFVCHIWRAAAEYCLDGTLCPDDCCYDYDYEYCCYDVASEWWFWFVWSFILLVILLTCCAVVKKRQQRQRQRQVIVVQQGYATTTGYGTLVNTEVPQRPYVPPMYNPYAGYPHPPPGPAPPYQQVAAPGAAAGPQQQPPYPDQTADSKQGEHNPSNYPPPPYNPGT